MAKRKYGSKAFIGLFPSRGLGSAAIIKRVARQRKLIPSTLEALPAAGLGWEIWRKR